MSELVSRAGRCRGVAGDGRQGRATRRALTNSTRRRLEWRHIGRLGGRVPEVRLQVVIA